MINTKREGFLEVLISEPFIGGQGFNNSQRWVSHEVTVFPAWLPLVIIGDSLGKEPSI